MSDLLTPLTLANSTTLEGLDGSPRAAVLLAPVRLTLARPEAGEAEVEDGELADPGDFRPRWWPGAALDE
jgi:hypothetical protein